MSDPGTALDVLPMSPLPAHGGDQMTLALRAYRDLQTALDRSMPEQIMTLDGKPFRKKGYWRAIAVAFNLTVDVVAEERIVAGAFDDGRENFGYRVLYRASTSNGGRSEPGDGSCFAVEKGRRGALQWKTQPAQATEHNVRAHAHTRAFNRAVSNLVGFGEVSYEEAETEDAPPPSVVEAPPPPVPGERVVGQHAPAPAVKTTPPKGALLIVDVVLKPTRGGLKGLVHLSDRRPVIASFDHEILRRAIQLKQLKAPIREPKTKPTNWEPNILELEPVDPLPPPPDDPLTVEED